MRQGKGKGERGKGEAWLALLGALLLACGWGASRPVLATEARTQLPDLPSGSMPDETAQLPEREPAPDPPAPTPDDLPPVLRGPLRESVVCPVELTELTPLLLRDIPTYANRVLQRSLGEVPAVTAEPPLSQYRPSYILLAGQAEQTPLDLSDQVYTTAVEAGENLEQLFFTTLERTYSGSALTEILHYHWLFLTPVEDGWHLAFMFSAIDAQGNDWPILPPQESSSGSVGRGVQLWLRDCRAGAIRR